MDRHCPFLAVSPKQIAAYVSSLGWFITAQIRLSRADPTEADQLQHDLRAVALRVQITVDDPSTIEHLVTAMHQRVEPWLIYESWAADVLCLARCTARAMNSICREALMTGIDAKELERAAANEATVIAAASGNPLRLRAQPQCA
ncbi:hypothetical protein [Burkholderia sp. 22PA0106]|uniref:hypothetical protein n=1 Tax=Burkholderia sp. 22PA0106 TaxID=3237371 RepID=UPI0039C0C347